MTEPTPSDRPRHRATISQGAMAPAGPEPVASPAEVSGPMSNVLQSILDLRRTSGAVLLVTYRGDW